MSPIAFAFNPLRFERMLRAVLEREVALRPDFEQALVDDATGRRLTPPLNNRTPAEGLTSAVKLAAMLLETHP